MSASLGGVPVNEGNVSNVNINLIQYIEAYIYIIILSLDSSRTYFKLIIV